MATLGSGADFASRQAVAFLSGLVLVRLLTPAEFGVFALLGTVVGVAVVAADGGLTTAILQAVDFTDEDADTAFWTATGLGVALSTVGLLVAGPLARAFSRQELTWVGEFLSLAVIGTSLCVVPTAILVKRSAFSRLAAIGTTATAVSGACAIAVAVGGYGIWALAVQSVSLPAANAVGLLLVGGYRPRLRWSRPSAVRQMCAGGWVLGTATVDVLFLRLQAVLVGTLFGAASLGRYQRADITQQLLADGTSTVVGRVALPLFAETAGRKDLLRKGFLAGIGNVSAINAPVMALLGGLSTPIVVALFGVQWKDAGPLLVLLAIAGFFYPLHVMALNVLYARSLNRDVFRLDVAKKVVGSVLLAGGCILGLRGIACAQVLMSLVAFLLNGRVVGEVLDLRVLDQVRVVAPVTGVAAIIGVSAHLVAETWGGPSWLELPVLGVGGLLTYVVMGSAFRVRAIRDLIALLRQSGRKVHV